MLNNYSQRLEMQIPQGNRQAGTTIMPKQEENLDEFLKSHFNFPSNNANQIQEFICKDFEMERIIHDLPKIIAKEFPNDDLSIDFADNERKEIDVTIFTKLNGKLSSDKQDLIEEELFNNYSWNAVNKILVCVEFEC